MRYIISMGTRTSDKRVARYKVVINNKEIFINEINATRAYYKALKKNRKKTKFIILVPNDATIESKEKEFTYIKLEKVKYRNPFKIEVQISEIFLKLVELLYEKIKDEDEVFINIAHGNNEHLFATMNAITLFRDYLKTRNKNIRIYILYLLQVDSTNYQVTSYQLDTNINLRLPKIKKEKGISQIIKAIQILISSINKEMILPLTIYIFTNLINTDESHVKAMIKEKIENENTKNLLNLLISMIYLEVYNQIINLKMKNFKKINNLLLVNLDTIKNLANKLCKESRLINREIQKVIELRDKISENCQMYSKIRSDKESYLRGSSDIRRNFEAHVGFNYDFLYICKNDNKIYVGYRAEDFSGKSKNINIIKWLNEFGEIK